MAKTPTSQQTEAKFKAWLEKGGEEELRKAMDRAKAASEDFSRATRVRTETLYEPVAF